MESLSQKVDALVRASSAVGLAWTRDDCGDIDRLSGSGGERQNRAHDYLRLFFVQVRARTRDAVYSEIGDSLAEQRGLTAFDATPTIGGTDEQANRLADLPEQFSE